MTMIRIGSGEDYCWLLPLSDPICACSTHEWTLRHLYRTSAVQCCYHQLAVDKMIPILFMSKDGSVSVSQIFISDKVQQTGNRTHLNYITRKRINCISELPYIAIIVDLGLPSSAFEAKWSSAGSKDADSLRIYAAGINSTTFPFLESHPSIADILRDIMSPPKSLTIQDLQAKMRYGSTCMGRHMCWEITNSSEDSNTREETATKRRRETSRRKGKKRRKGLSVPSMSGCDTLEDV